ncbi:MAG TPA: bifunctional DNA primase/polymerase [Phycisphaerae bacterium]|nr:bifunctional DNA primase/polymerase [Phycisphaerae bacterium]
MTTNSDLPHNVQYGYGLGWSFTPLNGKTPKLPAWQAQPRESLEQALQWAGEGNVGLRTGQTSGVIVIDVDSYKGADCSSLELPATVTAYTGRDGMHLYYLCSKPLHCSASRLGRFIDVKGDGGQVVFPGSIHPETHEPYVWAEGYEPWSIEVAELPDRIYGLLEAPRGPVAAAGMSDSSKPPATTPAGHPRAPRASRYERYAQTALKLEVHAVDSARDGTRNDALNKAAFSMGTLVGGTFIDRVTVETQLRQAALAAGLELHEIEATLRSGLDAGEKEPRDLRLEERDRRSTRHKTAKATKEHGEAGDGAKGGSDDEDVILIPGTHSTDNHGAIEQSNLTFAEDVLAGLPEDVIYRRDFLAGDLVGTAGRRGWIEFTENHMRILIDRYLRLGKWVLKRTGERLVIYQPCTRDAAGLVIAYASRAPGVRDLRLIVPYPVYVPGWQRLSAGWQDGYYYDEPAELVGLDPQCDQGVIWTVLHDLVVDFPFKTDSDRQNFFGLLLTPLVAPALDGNRPLHLLQASIARTGKSKLAEEVFGGVIIGEQTPAMQITNQGDEERDKRMIALLLRGQTIVHLDNLPNYIDSQALSSLLTATTYAGRLLGGNKIVNLPNTLTIVASGNNTQASAEIIKRSVPIVLQATAADPEARRDFKHPNLRAYVREQRRTVLSALIGMVENWLAAGRQEHGAPLGGFEGWSKIVGGVLQVNGFTEWRKNETNWRMAHDPRGQEMAEFVKLWWTKIQGNETEAQELIELANHNEMFANILSKPSRQAVGAAFGKMLRGYVDAPIAEWFVRWRLGRHAWYWLEPIMKGTSQ